MTKREKSGLLAMGKNPVTALILLGFTGAALSFYIARQETSQYDAIERLRLDQMVDAHFASVQDHLAMRENLAYVVATLFNPPPLSTPRPLGGFGNQIIALVPDLQSVGWLPEVAAANVNDALTALTDSGVENPRILGRDSQPLVTTSAERPLYPIIDIAPDENRRILGIDAGSFPDRLTAIESARITRSVTRTQPLRLIQAPESSAVLLYAPVFDAGVFRGVLGFGYKIDKLLANALSKPKVPHGFSVRVFTENVDAPLIDFDSNGKISMVRVMPTSQRRTTIERSADFAGRPLKFAYIVNRDIASEGLWRGFWFVSGGLTLTAAAIAFLGFLAIRASALVQEVDSRRSAEERLKVLIHELNHRVRNVLSVAQAVVRLSFTSAYNLTDVQKTCEGRLQALANAMSMLTASDWKGVSLLGLISEEILPFADRITIKGPDIALRSRPAQTFALLFCELAANAARYGSLSVAAGKVFLEWHIDRSGPEPIFRLTWKEEGGPAIAPPKRRGFGELLVRRIAPRDVAGHSKVHYEPHGFAYELEAPLREILYVGGGDTKDR